MFRILQKDILLLHRFLIVFPELCDMNSSPWRIVDDCGGAFTMGAIGGGIFQAVKGFRNAPSVNWPCSVSAQGFQIIGMEMK